MKEQNILKTIMLAVTQYTKSRIFRNNTGTGWVGESKRISKRTSVFLNPGDVVIRNARPLRAGLCVGSSDLIGWSKREITPEMVGKEIAIFTAIEVKTESGRIRKEQLNFIEKIKKDGGIAGIARSEGEAVDLINKLCL